MNLRSIAILLALFGAAACSEPSERPPGTTWVGTITTEGNITTVVNESGSVWGGVATLIEEVSIGLESGDDPYLFGNVRDIVANDTRIYVLDVQVPIVRVFDRQGVHLQDLGRGGPGPGEFQRPRALALDGQGRLYVLEDREIEIFSSGAGESMATWSIDRTASLGGGWLFAGRVSCC